jgi:hypothetical protein
MICERMVFNQARNDKMADEIMGPFGPGSAR